MQSGPGAGALVGAVGSAAPPLTLQSVAASCALQVQSSPCAGALGGAVGSAAPPRVLEGEDGTEGCALRVWPALVAGPLVGAAGSPPDSPEAQLGPRFCDTGQVAAQSLQAQSGEQADALAGDTKAVSLAAWRQHHSLRWPAACGSLGLGLALYEAVLDAPCRLGSFVRSFSVGTPLLRGGQRFRDVLPLPVVTPEVAEIRRLAQLRRFEKKEEQAAAGQAESLWVWLVVSGLNYEYVGHMGAHTWFCPATLTSAQKSALECIREGVAYFVSNCLSVHTFPHWPDEISRKRVDYDGDEISHALPVRALELAPGLPDLGIGGSVNAVEHVEEDVKLWLQDPSLVLLPRSEWPARVPKARVQVESNEEWHKVARLLWERGILEVIAEEDIFTVGGVKVLNGVFAVEKRGTPLQGQDRVTRFILNMVPANSYIKMLDRDLSTLTPSTTWTSIPLAQGHVLLWSGDDQKGAFFVWRLPSAWRPFMTLGRPVPGSLVGSGRESVYLSCAVIPMGWLLAVSLFQHLHRRLGFGEFPFGASFPGELEWRRDRPWPLSPHVDRQSWLQYYLDDFDNPEIVTFEEARRIEGTPSDRQLRQREAYTRNGVAWAPQKSHHRQLRVERMGAWVDGETGRVSVTVGKALQTAHFAAWLALQPSVSPTAMLMGLGRLVRAFEFRRPLMCTLNAVWGAGRWQSWRSCSGEMVTELLLACCLMPLAFTDLRARVDHRVSVTDASEAGGGACISVGLTAAGRAEACSPQFKALVSPSVVPAVPRSLLRCPKVLCVGLFDGLGGLRVALSRLPVVVIGFISSEVDRTAKRLVRRRWPGVIEWGDITQIDRRMVDAAAGVYRTEVDVVLVGAGSPCQDLSQLLAGRTGLRGSRSSLFFEIPRLLSLLKEAFTCPVEYFIENVFSMPRHDLQEFNRVLGMTGRRTPAGGQAGLPFMVDACDFSFCRRPRLYWCSWELCDEEGLTVIHKGDYLEVRPTVPKRPAGHWIEEDWELPNPSTLMYTFTRALPRETPPRAPAGLDKASAEAKARWKLHRYMFQVYQFEDRYLLQHKLTGLRRLPTPEEREVLMGIDSGYTRGALKSHEDRNLSFVTRCQLIGNSFCCSVVAWLVSHLLLGKGLIERPVPYEALLATHPSPEAWGDKPQFVQSGETDLAASRDLVLSYLRIAERGGSDVRLDLGIPFRPKAWPRAGIKPGLWKWKILHGYKWPEKGSQHINLLEMRAALNCLKWRTRHYSHRGVRFLHLLDSQVSVSILTRGRSSSLRLRFVLRRFNALALATGCYPLFAYVHSEDNPADAPSRWARNYCRVRRQFLKRNARAAAGCRTK